MRILLAHNSVYYPSHGGGDKSNRLLMQALAARGHQVRVVSRIERFGDAGHHALIDQLKVRAVAPTSDGLAIRFPLDGVDVRTLTLDSNLRAFFTAQIADFDPDVVLTSTDDPAQLLFDIAVRSPRARVVHLVRATIAVPFGPDSSMPSRIKTAALRQASAIVGVSEYVASYVRREGPLDAVHVPISLMEPGAFADVGSFDSPYLTIVNPCAVKGIGIFTALAERLPHLQFAAVPTWGTNAGDLASLAAHPNITMLDPVDRIDELLRQTRVALVPSIWAEARSRFVVEAMLRGVPVVASDAGGIREAKLGVPYLLPVNLIQRYQPTLDENLVPVAECPPQNLDPWLSAIKRLTSDRSHWNEVAQASRSAALAYAANLSVVPFEQILESAIARPKPAASASPASSDARRRLAAALMKQRASTPAASPWFPLLKTAEPGKPRLFCFPHAGGGIFAFRDWIGATGTFAVCPILYPGRDARSSEPFIDNMPQMADAIATALQPYVREPYAFFGHSMGGGIAYEVARRLERPPAALFISAVRSPQFRIGREPVPDPPRQDLLDRITALGGIPDALLRSEAAMSILLPVIEADARLYRNYRFEPGPPLAIPIFAYGGVDDAQVKPEYLTGWAELTSANFQHREFPGGHFYHQSGAVEVLSAIEQDLALLKPSSSTP